MKKIFKFSLVILISIVVLLEMMLRWYGFCSAPLYDRNSKFEYITKPNQEGIRFGNRYKFNSYSQRSDNPSKKRKRILGLGDSVINGGVLTDQDSLATSILSKNSDYQLLNISAGSWGPDNLAAYLNEFGVFNAEKMILFCSSHDSHDNMDFTEVVGIHPSYPDRQYQLAIMELIDRYMLPYFFGASDRQNQDIIKNGIEFNSGFNELKNMAKRNQMSLIIYLHPEQTELKFKRYNNQGQEIVKWADANKIKLIKGIHYNFNSEDYRDNIHLNESGQRKLSKIIKRII